MYEHVKSSLLWLLRVPPEPHDPMGDVQSLRVFRAAPGYLRYITLGWFIAQLALLAGPACDDEAHHLPHRRFARDDDQYLIRLLVVSD